MSAFFDFLYDNEGKVGWRMNQDAKEKLKETLYREMMAYDAGDPARIQHFVKRKLSIFRLQMPKIFLSISLKTVPPTVIF